MNLWHYIEQAGVIGYILVAISGISICAGIERAIFWLTQKKFSSKAQKNALKEIKNRTLSNLATEHNSPFGRSLKIVRENDGEDLKGESLRDMAMHRETRKLYRFTGLLDNNSAIAPMLGILGTMLGIIQSFSGMSSGAPDTTVMVAGISVAMLTTAIGLIVSIISLLFYNIFSSLAYNTQLELAEFMTEVGEAIDNRDKENIVDTSSIAQD